MKMQQSRRKGNNYPKQFSRSRAQNFPSTLRALFLLRFCTSLAATQNHMRSMHLMGHIGGKKCCLLHIVNHDF